MRKIQNPHQNGLVILRHKAGQQWCTKKVNQGFVSAHLQPHSLFHTIGQFHGWSCNLNAVWVSVHGIDI